MRGDWMSRIKKSFNVPSRLSHKKLNRACFMGSVVELLEDRMLLSLSVAATADSQATHVAYVSWSGSTATPFTLNRSTDGGSTFSTIASGLTGSSYIDVGAPGDTSIKYQVVASDSSSAISSAVSTAALKLFNTTAFTSVPSLPSGTTPATMQGLYTAYGVALFDEIDDTNGKHFLPDPSMMEAQANNAASYDGIAFNIELGDDWSNNVSSPISSADITRINNEAMRMKFIAHLSHSQQSALPVGIVGQLPVTASIAQYLSGNDGTSSYNSDVDITSPDGTYYTYNGNDYASFSDAQLDGGTSGTITSTSYSSGNGLGNVQTLYTECYALSISDGGYAVDPTDWIRNNAPGLTMQALYPLHDNTGAVTGYLPNFIYITENFQDWHFLIDSPVAPDDSTTGFWKSMVAACGALADGAVLWDSQTTAFPTSDPWWKALTDGTGALLKQGPSPLPAIPSSLSLTNTAGGHLSWSAPSPNTNVVGYMIERSDDSGSTWNIVGEQPVGTTTWYDHNLTGDGSTKYYRVRSFNQYAVSDPTSSVSNTIYRNAADLNWALNGQVDDVSDTGLVPLDAYVHDRYHAHGTSWMEFDNVVFNANLNLFQFMFSGFGDYTDAGSATIELYVGGTGVPNTTDPTAPITGGTLIGSGPVQPDGNGSGVGITGNNLNFAQQSIPINSALASISSLSSPKTLFVRFIDIPADADIQPWNFQFTTAPTGVQATSLGTSGASSGYDGAVTILWDGGTSYGNTGQIFHLYRDYVPGGSNTPIYSGTTPSFTDQTLLAGHLYKYQVSQDPGTGVESPLSPAAAVLLGSANADTFTFTGNRGQFSATLITNNNAATQTYSGLVNDIGSLKINTLAGSDTVNFGDPSSFTQPSYGVPGLSMAPGRSMYLISTGTLTFNLKGGVYYNPAYADLATTASNLSVNLYNQATAIFKNGQSFSSLQAYDDSSVVFSASPSISSIGFNSANTTLKVTSGATVALTGSQTIGTLDVVGSTVTLGASSSTSTHNIYNVQSLDLSSTGLLKMATYHTSTSNDSVLVLANSPSITDTAVLDITDNFLIVNDDSSTSMTNIRNLIINGRGGSGYGNATWNGTGGITSTRATVSTLGLGGVGNGFNLAVGYADNGDFATYGLRPTGSYTAFGGQSVSSNCILIRMTRGADITLDGVVDSQDVSTFNSKYSATATDRLWETGDFDYDGMCYNSDYTVLGSTYNATAPKLAPT